MQELRANTQVIVTVGPFVDVGDGFTPQTDIALSGNEAELIKHGSTTVVDISGATWAAVTNCRGYYSLTLTTSHTDTEGLLVVIVQDDSDCLPVKQEYMVLAEAAWDSKYVAKDAGLMDVHIKTIEAGIIANASFNADVGSTAHGTNIIALAVRKILEELNLDHLLKVVTAAADMTTEITDNSILSRILANGDTSVFAPSTDGLQPIRDEIVTAHGLLATEAKQDTIDGIVDAILAMLDDARGEPAQGAPPVNPDAMTKLDYLYTYFRNRILQTATLLSLLADDESTVICKATVSDDATTFIKQEFISG